MKECQECRRLYYDETLNFCLDDGSVLTTAPSFEAATAKYSPSDPRGRTFDEPTVILPSGLSRGLGLPNSNRGRKIAVLLTATTIVLAGIFAYQYLIPHFRQSETAGHGAQEQAKLYWQMT